MKQDLVYFKLYHTYAQASHGVITSRAALKMSKLAQVYINDIRIHNYTGRQNNN
jgi:hypothetical protein